MTMEINPKSTFDINLTSLILKIQSPNDNRKSHYTKFWYYLLKKRYKKRDRLTSILKIQEMFWFDPTKKVSIDSSQEPMLTIASCSQFSVSLHHFQYHSTHLLQLIPAVRRQFRILCRLGIDIDDMKHCLTKFKRHRPFHSLFLRLVQLKLVVEAVNGHLRMLDLALDGQFELISRNMFHNRK